MDELTPDSGKSDPVKGDVGLVFVPESGAIQLRAAGDTAFTRNRFAEPTRRFSTQIFSLTLSRSITSGVQDHLSSLSGHADPGDCDKIAHFVEQGGALVSEGLPAYFGDHGHVGRFSLTMGSMNYSARARVMSSSCPDISDDMVLQVRGARFTAATSDRIIIAGGVEAWAIPKWDHRRRGARLGQGRSLLIGSFPGAGYSLHHSPGAKSVFAGFMEWAGVARARNRRPDSVQARAHQGAGGTSILGYKSRAGQAHGEYALAADMGSFYGRRSIWGNRKVAIDGQKITLDIPGRDEAVIELR